MKSSYKYLILVSGFCLFVSLLNAQPTGLSWINLFGSKGIERSPGFVYHHSGSLFLAVVFDQKMVLPQSHDTITPKGNTDGLIIKLNQMGTILETWQLSNRGHLTITGLSATESGIVITGNFQDSLFVHKSNASQFLLKTDKVLGAFVLEMSASGDIASASNPFTDALYASTNHLASESGSNLFASVAIDDSVAALRNFIDSYSASFSKRNMLHYSALQSVLGVCHFNEKAAYYGAFKDTLVLGNDSLVSRSGKDAYIGVLDADRNFERLLSFGSLQHAEAMSAVSFNSLLWVAVNFSDSLFLPNGDTVTSGGSNDCLIAAFNNEFVLTTKIQLSGQLAERVDKLFVQDQTLYVFANISSPNVMIYLNDSLCASYPQNNLYGNAALFSVDTTNNVNLIWKTQHDWTSKIISLRKAGPSETIISGLFTDQLSVDSIQYQSMGGTDVFILKLEDNCINSLKSAIYHIQVCEGDSLFIPHLIANQDGSYRYDPSNAAGIFVHQTSGLLIKHILDCGCNASDSLVFVFGRPSDMLKSGFSKQNSVYLANTKIQLLYNYCGECASQYGFTVQALPNPFKQNVSLKVSMPEAGKLSYKIFGTDGAVLALPVVHKLSHGSHDIELFIKHLKPGTYILQLSCTTSTITETHYLKLIKQ
jgi:hypothetical protein